MILFGKEKADSKDEELEQMRESLRRMKARADLAHEGYVPTEDDITRHLAHIEQVKAAKIREAEAAEQRQKEDIKRRAEIRIIANELVMDGTIHVSMMGHALTPAEIPKDGLSCPHCGRPIEEANTFIRNVAATTHNHRTLLAQGRSSPAMAAQMFTGACPNHYVPTGFAGVLITRCEGCKNGAPAGKIYCTVQYICGGE